MDMLAQYVPIVHIVIAVFTVIELGLMAYGERFPHSGEIAHANNNRFYDSRHAIQ